MKAMSAGYDAPYERVVVYLGSNKVAEYINLRSEGELHACSCKDDSVSAGWVASALLFAVGITQGLPVLERVHYLAEAAKMLVTEDVGDKDENGIFSSDEEEIPF